MASGSRPIVVFGDDWGRHVSSMQHVFRHIVSRRPVIWVNGIGHRPPTLSGADLRRVWEKGRRVLGGGSIEPVQQSQADVAPWAVIEPKVLPWHGHKAVDVLNRWSLLRAIRGRLTALDARLAPLLVTGSPPSVCVLGRLGEAGSVYYCMDDFLHLPGVSAPMLAPLEQRLLARIDITVATAHALTLSKVPRSGRTHYLPQGVNYEHFAAPRSVPVELRDLPRPLIGFAGGVSDCCDFPLLRALARAHPSGTIVLVGPLTAAVDVRRELAEPNIRLLGSRPYADLPAYVQAFDVAVIPYVLNDWTRAVDPLKLLEYLAAGVPVVSTPLPEVEKYRDVITIAEADGEAWRVATTAALGQSGEAAAERRRAVARRHTWAARAEEFLGVLDSLEAGFASHRDAA